MRKMKRFIKSIKKTQIIGVVIALITVILAFLFLKGTDIFYFVLGIAFVIAGLPFFVALVLETNTTREKEEMFLEFSRDLVEGVKSGTPISKGILNLKLKDYGNLTPYVDKLANQISLGIPIKTALDTFARDVDCSVVTSAITIIGESEKAGGQIEDILEAVAKSVAQVQKLKKERRAAIYSLIVQGYIIFMIFIIIMLVMEFKILPIASGLGEGLEGVSTSEVGLGGGLGGILGGETATSEELARPFLWLLIVQGFFAGIVIGKLAEGNIKSGLKHSFALVVLALLINTGAKAFIG